MLKGQEYALSLRRAMKAVESAKARHSWDTTIQSTIKPGRILCGNNGSNASSLKEMAEAHKTGEKQGFVLQNKNIK